MMTIIALWVNEKPSINFTVTQISLYETTPIIFCYFLPPSTRISTNYYPLTTPLHFPNESWKSSSVEFLLNSL